MGRAASETILHGLVAAAAVMFILNAGRIRAPVARLRYWLLAMACPAVVTPLFWLIFPGRTGEPFRDQWSLLSGSHFSMVSWHGVRAGAASALVFAIAGSLLYLRDLVPFAVDVSRARARRRKLAPVPETLSRSVARAATALGTAPARTVVIASQHPTLICRGLRRPVIVTSTGLLDLLAPDELDAAIAHEMCHARWRDPLAGWVLMIVRGIFFFNPSVQLCARAAAHEIERRADQGAASTASGPASVARSLGKLAGGGNHPPAGSGAWHGFRLAAIEHRRFTLLDESAANPPPRWTLAATAIGLGVILFFTVA
jgi:Zn-dependent protease with chaperone function